MKREEGTGKGTTYKLEGGKRRRSTVLVARARPERASLRGKLALYDEPLVVTFSLAVSASLAASSFFLRMKPLKYSRTGVSCSCE